MYARLIHLGCILVRTLALWRENDRSNWFPLVTNAIAPELPISPTLVFPPYVIPHMHKRSTGIERVQPPQFPNITFRLALSITFFIKGVLLQRPWSSQHATCPRGSFIIDLFTVTCFQITFLARLDWVDDLGFFRENDSWHEIWDLPQTLYTNDYTCRKPSVRLQLFILHE